MDTEKTTLEKRKDAVIITDMKQIVTDNPDFRYLITYGNGNLVYVDKSAYLHKLLTSPGKFYFISRPRRFGKSLTCNTLEAIFRGRKELFEGLAISRTDYDFRSYPVLHFDFSKLSAVSYEDFLNDFSTAIRFQARDNGIAIEEGKPSSMLDELLDQLEEPVIIIDEFDSPIITSVSDGESKLAEAMRKEFNAFYNVIKNYTGKIRFFFMTGVTKLSGLSIFSAMNNLKDISLSPEYAGMLGYTEEELEYYFSEHIDEYLTEEDREYDTREELLSALRDYYDGYRFSPKSEVTVYNPVSIGRFFSETVKSFDNYWVLTGGMSTLVVTQAKSHSLVNLFGIGLEKAENSTLTGAEVKEDNSPPIIDSNDLSCFDITTLKSGEMTRDAVYGLLYYSGYLTIAGVKGSLLSLDFPNLEVRTTFLKRLLSAFNAAQSSYLLRLANDAKVAAEEGDTAEYISSLNTFLSEFTFADYKAGYKEPITRDRIKVMCNLMGVQVFTEVPAGGGIADVVFIAGLNNYILELKVDGKRAIEAMKQIDRRKYGDVFTFAGGTTHTVGIDFRTDERQIVSFTERIDDGETSEAVLPLSTT